MSWAVGYDSDWQRDIGYGVPAFCDYPGCGAEIDRGLGHVCGGEPYGGDHGCGLYFCARHLHNHGRQLCGPCTCGVVTPHTPTPDHPDWIKHKLTDPSWQAWRAANPAKVLLLQKLK